MLTKKSLKNICIKRLKKRNLYNKVYINILKKELKAIHKQDYYKYFNKLIKNKIKFDQNKNGLLIAYLLNLTKVNPIEDKIKHKFLLHGDYPDIDQDIEDIRRDDVKQYLANKYGKNNISNIISFTRLRVKSLLHDLARIYGISNEVIPISKIIKTNETYEQACEKYKELQDFKNKMQNGSKQDKLFFRALEKLDGAYRHYATHASGFVISPIRLSSVLPLMKRAGQDIILTGWCEGQDAEEKRELTDIGLIKFDLLGLSSLTIVHQAVRFIKEINHDFKLVFEQLDLTDKKVLDAFKKARSIATFQFESPGIRKFLKKMQPDRFEDLIAANALYRPGPIESGMLDIFIENKKNPDKIQYIDNRLEPILHETYGCLVYQEQIMEICAVLGNYSPEETNDIRKLLTKFIQKGSDLPKNIIKKLAIQKKKLIKRFIDNGIESSKAEIILKQLMEFNKYSFNKSHSAVYASLAFICQYLKVYYPLEYMTASLIYVSNDSYLESYIKESVRLKLKFAGIDINKSKFNFYTDHEKIYMGFNKIFGCAIKSATVLQDNQPYDNIDDFMRKIKGKRINKTILKSLFQVGAFNRFFNDRINNAKDKNEEQIIKQQIKIEIIKKLKIEEENIYVYGLDNYIDLNILQDILRTDENCLRHIYGDSYKKFNDLVRLNVHKAQCQKCDLSQLKENINKISIGDRLEKKKSIDIMIINDTPYCRRMGNRASYDLQISKMIKKLATKHNKNVYFVNAISCSDRYSKNFEPQTMNGCKEWLFNEILILKPKLIITIGKLTRELFGGNYNDFHKLFLGNKNWKVYCTYNPYYILLDNKRKLKEDEEYIKSLKTEDKKEIDALVSEEAEKRKNTFFRKKILKLLKKI